MNTSYSLKCLGSGEVFKDTDLQLESGKSEKPAFLRAVYDEKQLNPRPDSAGLFKFASWLPVNREIKNSSAPVTYKSSGLAGKLGLDNLYITFSGYWPKKRAGMVTGTFKECEAYSVCSRLPENFSDVLVVASAGNTARAFIHVCSKNNIPVAVVVPERNLGSIWADHDVNPCVRVIASGGNSDYFDAISLSRTVCSLPGFVPEGGAKNVARRDGMSTTVLSAVTEIGSIPEYYFQAVGSGTGAIAAWEANLRLLGDGRFGDTKMKLMVSQNAPFLVLYDSWKQGSRDLVEITPDRARDLSDEIDAKVLSNRVPPYSVIGGMYDALAYSGGSVFSVDNKEAANAGDLFKETEGIDLAPAAKVAIASLQQAVKQGEVSRESVIMVNVTGGGYEKIREEGNIRLVEPSIVVDPNADNGSVKAAIESIF
ncbi:MAG: cysteate synthase [Spirochaetales bacterium]|jgi:cysteate synthase|nr:cysteate synthase [Spirochaetales bacterium]